MSTGKPPNHKGIEGDRCPLLRGQSFVGGSLLFYFKMAIAS